MPKIQYNPTNSQLEVDDIAVETAHVFADGTALATYLALGVTYQTILLKEDITLTVAVTIPEGTIFEGQNDTKLILDYNSAGITMALSANVKFRNLTIECVTQNTFAGAISYITFNAKVTFENCIIQFNSVGTIPAATREFVCMSGINCSGSVFKKVEFKLLPAITNYLQQVIIGKAAVNLSEMQFEDILISGFGASEAGVFVNYLMDFSSFTNSKILNFNSTYPITNCTATQAVLNLNNVTYSAIDKITNIAVNASGLQYDNFGDFNGCSLYFVTNITSCTFNSIISKSPNVLNLTGDSISGNNFITVGNIIVYTVTAVLKNLTCNTITLVPNALITIDNCIIGDVISNQRTVTLTVTGSTINKIINPSSGSAGLTLEAGSANSTIGLIKNFDTITLSALTNMTFGKIVGGDITINLTGNSVYSNIVFNQITTSGATGTTLGLNNPRTGVYVDLSGLTMINVTKLTTNGVSHNVSNCYFKNVNFSFNVATPIIEGSNLIFEQCSFITTSGTTLYFREGAKDIKINNFTITTFTNWDIYGTNIEILNGITNGCKIKTMDAFVYGTATGGDATTLSDNIKNWVANYLNGFYLYVVKAFSEAKAITATALTTLTVGTDWAGGNPGMGTKYGVVRNPNYYGIATSGANTTITDTTKSWGINALVNYRIRIISGTGVGEGIIVSNTATVITVKTQWATNPNNTSHYIIGGKATNCVIQNVNNSSYAAVTDNYFFGEKNQVINCNFSAFTISGEDVELKNCSFNGNIILDNSNYLKLNNCRIVGNITLNNVCNYVTFADTNLIGNFTLTTGQYINYLILSGFAMTGAFDVQTGTNIKISNSNFTGASSFIAGAYIYINNSFFSSDFTLDDVQYLHVIGCTILGTVGEIGVPTYTKVVFTGCYMNTVNIPTATDTTLVVADLIGTATSLGGATNGNNKTGA